MMQHVSFLILLSSLILSTTTLAFTCTRSIICVRLEKNRLRPSSPPSALSAEDSNSFAEFQQQLEVLAQRTSKDPSASQQALNIFDEMLSGSAEDVPTAIYNILLEVLAYSADKDGAQQAESILKRMQEAEAPDARITARPDLETYAKVMEAWSRRNRLDKVEELFQELKGEENDSELKPNTYIYNKLIRAYGVAGEPAKAESILEELLEASTNDQGSRIRPNHKTWLHVLRAYGPNSETNPKTVEKIKSLLNRMDQGQQDWRPGVQAYNVLLRALSHQRRSSKEAEGILYEMIEKSKNGDTHIRPNSESFYNAINAFRGETAKGVGFKVQKLLEIQNALHESFDSSYGDKNLKPSMKSHLAAMNIISRTRDSKKAIKAKRLADRIKTNYVEKNDESFAPNLVMYRNLLNSCAYTPRDASPEDKMAAFQVAADAFNELRKLRDVAPDSAIYSLFLKTCGNLMPASRKRDDVVENVFNKCCQDGLLNDYVMRDFENASSEELQLRLLGGFVEDGVTPPPEWSRNI